MQICITASCQMPCNERGKDVTVIIILIFLCKWMHAGLNVCIILEIYDPEMRNMQVDGSMKAFYRQNFEFANILVMLHI